MPNSINNTTNNHKEGGRVGEVGAKKSERNARFGKILMSVIFPPAVLGPEMAAPILWAPWNFLVLFAGKPPCP